MLKKLSAFRPLTFIVLIAPLQAIAQQPPQPTAPPPGYFWPGPWHMWNDGYGSPFWWMFPLMMLCMFLIAQPSSSLHATGYIIGDRRT
jgi:hypothetical protein